jgi:hypothetical protein
VETSGVFFLCVWGFLFFQRRGVCVWFGRVWRLVSVLCVFVFFAFLVCRIEDRGAVVRFIGGLLDIHLRC